MLALLNVLSVALGIAVYLAIQIANHSANRSFAAGVDLVSGKSHLEVRGEIDDTLFPLVAKLPEAKGCTPLIEGVVTLPNFPGEYLQVLGVDVFTNLPFRTFELGDETNGQFDLERWLAEPDGIAVTAAFAQKYGLKIGDRIHVLVNSRLAELRIRFFMNLTDSAASTNIRFAAMDIGWAQELFQMRGRLSSVQILLAHPDKGEAIATELQKMLPPGATVAPPGQRSFQIQKMLSSFELNLTALSMVSMLVGMFLIYNTISASVTRRRLEIGILRSMGATRGEVRLLFLGEACVFGIVGIGLGAAGGVALGNVLIGSVAKTISSLYVLVSIDRSFFSATHFLSAAFFGMGAVLLGAWMPANEAAATDPVQALSFGNQMQGAIQKTPRWFLAGIGALALALVCSRLALVTPYPWLGFVAALFVLLGFSLFAPATTRIAGEALGRLFTGRLLLRLAAENLRRSLHRNAMTVAALAAAIAMMISVTVMIFSFRNSVDTWINRGIVADLYIAPASNEIIGLSAFVPGEAVRFLEKQPGVEAVDTFREITTMLDGKQIAIAAVKGADRRNLKFTGGNELEKMAKFFGGDYVIVTESFAQKLGVHDGDMLTLQTPRGPAQFQIAGTYRDYTRDRGLIMIDRKNFDKWWNDPRVQSLAVYVGKSADAEKIADDFRKQFSSGGEFIVYSNKSLRQRILAIFDQTFAVTYVLRLIAIIVAIVGIFLSVTALVAERQREIGVLRAIGASRGQIQRWFMAEAALIGLVSSLLGIVAGACLSMVLTWVVNKAFFGWTIDLQFPWTLIAFTPLWIVPAAVIAAAFPALQASRIDIATAVRSE